MLRHGNLFPRDWQRIFQCLPSVAVGELCRTISRMLDRAGRQGLTISGFMPQLAPLLGDVSFHRGAEDTRFAVLLRSDLPLARDLRDVW